MFCALVKSLFYKVPETHGHVQLVTLYITLSLGVPGTGKTATVKQVMRYMEENSDEFPEFKFYEMNGMRLGLLLFFTTRIRVAFSRGHAVTG